MPTASLTCSYSIPIEDVVSLAKKGAYENGIALERHGNNLHGERLPFKMDIIIEANTFTITVSGPNLPFGMNPNAIIGKIRKWLNDKGITAFS